MVYSEWYTDNYKSSKVSIGAIIKKSRNTKIRSRPPEN